MRAHKKVFTYNSKNVTIFSQRCLRETKQRIKEVTLSFEIKKPAGNKKGDARNSIDNQVIMGRLFSLCLLCMCITMYIETLICQ